jgi:hypothetical protein
MNYAYQAAKCIEEFLTIDMPPKHVSNLFLEILVGMGWFNKEDAADYASSKIDYFKRHLRKKLISDQEIFRISYFEFNAKSEHYIQGSCFVGPDVSESEKQEKRFRSRCVDFTFAFRSIGNSDFEKLCARVISLWKTEESYVTRLSADQGVDFFGRVPFGELIKPSVITNGAEKQLKIWLVGQAKNYSATQVSTKDIRELVGSVHLARAKTYAGSIDPLSSLQIRVCDPVFYIFFTTGIISKDAWDLLRKSGVIAMDGRQLSIFLADHGVGLSEDGFDSGAFNSWLHA